MQVQHKKIDGGQPVARTKGKPMKRWIAGSCMAIGACAAAMMPTLSSAQAVAPATAQLPVAVSTTLKGVRFAPLSVLPAGPGADSQADQCPNATSKPVSPAALAVQRRGWPVTGEAKLGRYQLVSFAGSFEAGTSSSCTVTQGNVAVFDAGKLIALAYAVKSTNALIGRIVPLEDGGVRVWSGDYPGLPSGDIRVTADGALQFGDVAAEESLCHGAAHVPNIYGMPIDKARKRLASQGWKAMPSHLSGPEFGERERTFTKRGVVEVTGCSGTGFGFCTFNYRGAAGRLSVVTVGDGEDSDRMPSVSDYSVTCR